MVNKEKIKKSLENTSESGKVTVYNLNLDLLDVWCLKYCFSDQNHSSCR